jgi:hypothetical protein
MHVSTYVFVLTVLVVFVHGTSLNFGRADPEVALSSETQVAQTPRHLPYFGHERATHETVAKLEHGHEMVALSERQHVAISEQEGSQLEIGEPEHEGGNGGTSLKKGCGESFGHSVAMGFAATVIIFFVVFAMANSSNRRLSMFTWRCLDNVISIFLAVLIFQAIDELVIDYGLLPKSHIVMASFIYATLLLCSAVGFSLLFKGSPANLAIYAASSAHFVGFGFMHASTLGFEHAAECRWSALKVFIAICFLLPCLYIALFYFKLHLGITSNPELLEKVDDVENDAGSMAFSISWTLMFCYWLTGAFHDFEAPTNGDPTRSERRTMMIYAISLTVAGGALVLWCFEEDSSQFAASSWPYFTKRVRSFGGSAIAMCIAWAWMVWGKWNFHSEHWYGGCPTFSRIWFAVIVSFVTMAVIAGLCVLPRGPRATEKEKLLLILTVSLLAGWSWEEVLDESIEVMTEDSSSPGHRHFWVAIYKFIAGVVLTAIVLPIHVVYFKPKVLSVSELADAEDDKAKEIGKPWADA